MDVLIASCTIWAGPTLGPPHTTRRPVKTVSATDEWTVAIPPATALFSSSRPKAASAGSSRVRAGSADMISVYVCPLKPCSPFEIVTVDRLVGGRGVFMVGRGVT